MKLPKVLMARPRITHANPAHIRRFKVDRLVESQVVIFHHEHSLARPPQVQWHRVFLQHTLTQARHHRCIHLGMDLLSLDNIQLLKVRSHYHQALLNSDNCLTQDHPSIVIDLPACNLITHHPSSAKAQALTLRLLVLSVCRPLARNCRLRTACSHLRRDILCQAKEGRLILRLSQAVRQQICVVVAHSPLRVTAFLAMASPTKAVVKRLDFTRTTGFGRTFKVLRLA
jgi:hypothetical protein